jgi:hypothetical protein
LHITQKERGICCCIDITFMFAIPLSLLKVFNNRAQTFKRVASVFL